MFFERNLLESANRSYAGIVYPDIDLAELADGTGREFFNILGIADIRFDGADLVSELPGFLLQLFERAFAASRGNNVGSHFCEFKGSSASEPAGRTSDDYNFVSHMFSRTRWMEGGPWEMSITAS